MTNAVAKVFIDGHAGTTGLRIRTLLADRADLEILQIADDLRKDPQARKAMLAKADVAILCLPDDAAREAVALAEGLDVRFIDASTAHRVHPDWVYGLPELTPDHREKVAQAKFVSNPGCYPTGVILLLRPLIDAGALETNTPISVHALSGYSGGGKGLIEKWQDGRAEGPGLVNLPFAAPYAFDKRHKHLPEMQRYSALAQGVQFVPSVGPFECGMRINIPLHASLLSGNTASSGKTAEKTAEDFHRVLTDRYAGEANVEVMPLSEAPDEAGAASPEMRFDPRSCNGSNRVRLWVLGNPDGHVVLVAVLDNLGKGASGAAVQNLNLMLGREDNFGL